MIDIYNVDLTNSNFWEVEQFVVRDVQRTQVGENPAYYPIPDFTIPIFQRAPIMAAQFENQHAKPHWKLGCYLKQSTPAPGGTSPDAFADISSWRIPLNSLLVFFPLAAIGPWQLRASIPYWHEQARVRIYRFTGSVDQPLPSRLTQIETTLNTILSRV